MARAEYVYTFKLDRFSDVNAGILNWPMSVIRLSSNNKDSLVNACDYILDKWMIHSPWTLICSNIVS